MKHLLICAAAIGALSLPISSAHAENMTTGAQNGIKKIEKTITTSYTVSTRRVGMVGGRPYPAKTEKIEGGERIETYIDDNKVESKIVRPEPEIVMPKHTSRKGELDRDYFTNSYVAEYYEEPSANVRVHKMNGFND